MIITRFASHAPVIGRFALVSALGVATLWTAHAQALEVTEAQRVACTPDVVRLCAAAVPNAGRVVACMRSNRVRVSLRCRSAFPASAWASNGDTKVASR